MGCFIFLFVVLALAGLGGLGWWLYRSWEESKCLEQADQAEEIWNARPIPARRTCEAVLKKMGRGKRQRTSAGALQAIAQAHLVLALIDQDEDREKDARWHLDKLRGLQLDEESIQQRLLRFHAHFQSTSNEAFETYLTCYRSDWAAEEPGIQKSVAAGLRQCCAVRSEMNESELTEQIKRNQAVRKVMPGALWSLRAEAQAWSWLRKPKRARVVLEELLSKHPDSGPDRVSYVRELIILGEKDRAKRELAQLLKEKPGDYDLLIDIARQQIALGDTQAANDNLNRVMAEAPALQGKAWTLLGTVALNGKDPEKALPWLKKAVAANPEDLPARLALAEGLSQKGDAEGAVQALKQTGRKAMPLAREYALACALFNSKQWGLAAEYFESCRKAGHRPAQCALLRLRALIQISDPRVPEALQQAEKLNPDHPDLAFWRGAHLFKTGAYQKALPFFSRASNAAGKKGDETLQRRAKFNLVACYWHLAGQHSAQKRYAEAAKAWEVVQKTLVKHPRRQAIIEALARCHFLSGVERYRKGGPKAGAEALEAVQRAMDLHPDPGVRSYLAGLCFQQGRCEEAAQHFNALLETSSQEESLQYAWGLAASRTSSADKANAALRMLAGKGGPYALRAALALASGHTDRGDHTGAVEVLMASAQAPSARNDPYYGELARAAIMSALRTGKQDWARELVLRLFTGGSGLGANFLMGALLSEGGEYEQALPLLEQVVQDARLRNSGVNQPAAKRGLTQLILGDASEEDRPTQLLMQVFRLSIRKACEQGDFDAVKKLVGRALAFQYDQELDRLASMILAASNAGVLNNSSADSVTEEQIIPLLDDMYQAAANPDIHLVRSAMVIHHRKACALSKAGQHRLARGHWQKAHEIWKRRIEGQAHFWRDYRTGYNDGQQYQIQMSEAELGQTLERRMAGVCVSLTGQAILKKSFDDAEFYWREAGRLTPESSCKEIFKEVVNIPELVGQLNPRTNRDEVIRLYRFLYDHIDRNEENRGQLVEHTLQDTFEALKEKDVRRFRRRLDNAVDLKPDLSPLKNRLARLSDDLLQTIISAVLGHSEMRKLAQTNSEMLTLLLFRAVCCYAELAEQIPGGLNSLMVNVILEQVLVLAIEAMKG